MRDALVVDEINKRLTLNWLIQGAAQHAGMTFHHLVRNELDALDPRLLRLYDQYALINLLQYWHADAALLLGWPTRFWRQARSKPSHPFFDHLLLSQYGGTLAAAARQRALERCKEKGLARWPVLFQLQAMYVMARLPRLEAPHKPKLIELAKKSTSTIWGIPIDRLDGDLALNFEFETPIRARSIKGRFFVLALVGLGGVVRHGDSLRVVGRGTNWQLLTKELVKGTAELICMHGLSNLSDDTYSRVVDAADCVEYEPSMLQTGGELWRRLLEVIPPGRPVADVLMCMARLAPKSLEALMMEVIEHPEKACQSLMQLGYETGLRIDE